MTEHRRRPTRRWVLALLVLSGLTVAGIGIGSALTAPTHVDVSQVDVSTTPPDPTPSHDLGVLPSAPADAASPAATTTRPRPSRRSATPPAATARPSATKTPSPRASVPTPSTSATKPPAPRPSSPRPTWSPTPPVLSPTEQLRVLVNQRRSTTPGGGGDLARYPGMDAYAQDAADRRAPADKGPYTGVTVITPARTAAAAARLLAPTDPAYNPAYTRVGIGFHADYWVLVFS